MARGNVYRQLEKLARELEEYLDELGDMEGQEALTAQEVEEVIEGIYNKITKLMSSEI